MSCPTCDHTMQALGCKVTDMTFYWCPRCGTIKPCDNDVVAPLLPERCRAFAVLLGSPETTVELLRKEWHRLGIGESIAPPAARDQIKAGIPVMPPERKEDPDLAVLRFAGATGHEFVGVAGNPPRVVCETNTLQAARDLCADADLRVYRHGDKRKKNNWFCCHDRRAEAIAKEIDALNNKPPSQR